MGKPCLVAALVEDYPSDRVGIIRAGKRFAVLRALGRYFSWVAGIQKATA